MTKEDFIQLAQAYGGEIGRWPAAIRDEAALLLASDPEFASSVLAREARLDEALDALPRPAPAAALYERILAQAPASRRRAWPKWLAPAGLGAALASVAAAGLIVGVQLGGPPSGAADASAQVFADLDVSAVAEVS